MDQRLEQQAPTAPATQAPTQRVVQAVQPVEDVVVITDDAGERIEEGVPSATQGIPEVPLTTVGETSAPPAETHWSPMMDAMHGRMEVLDGRLDVVFEALGDIRSLLMGTRPYVPEPQLLDEPEPQGHGGSLLHWLWLH